VLRRPVAVVLRHPGGDSAAEMLQAAVAASRVLHPNLVGVYDAIDEQERAYVVREWVDGESLRDLVAAEGPLDPARAIAIAHSVADALAAVHATGMIHGNVHPGTTLVGDDGRVVLADARADASDSTESDIRAVGGILYFALTGHWPHAEAGRSGLPDAIRDGSDMIAAPRQARAGIPAYLDDLTMDLLDKRIAAPESGILAAELARLDSHDDYEADAGPLRFVSGGGDPGDSPRATRKIVLGVAALLVIAAVGLVFGIRAVSDSSEANNAGTTTQQNAGTASQGGNATGTDAQSSPEPKKLSLSADQVRIVDPPGGDRSDVDEAPMVVDGNKQTGWDTQGFNQARFYNKPGMGVLINLGSPHKVSEVRVDTSAPGALMQMRTGTTDPGNSSPGDDQIAKTFTPINDSGPERTEGTRAVFLGFDPDTKYQYLLLWITELPQAEDGRYRLTVEELEVYGV
jgi:eukaryotic-like serine/threonine-protein kinase